MYNLPAQWRTDEVTRLAQQVHQREWLYSYLMLELGFTLPIVNALEAYGAFFGATMDLYRQDPHTFPMNHYQDPAVLAAIVSVDGLRLRDVHEQTFQLCLRAVTQNGLALQYVQTKTQELCLIAVRKNGSAIGYVEKQTLALCLAAVQERGEALIWIREEGEVAHHYEQICLAALHHDPYAYKYIPTRRRTQAVNKAGRWW